MKFTEQEREYLEAVKIAPLALIADYLRVTCPECARKIADINHTDVAWRDFREEHAMIGPFVVIGCEGFLVINPLQIGLTSARWIKIADEFNELPPHAL